MFPTLLIITCHYRYFTCLRDSHSRGDCLIVQPTSDCPQLQYSFKKILHRGGNYPGSFQSFSSLICVRCSRTSQYVLSRLQSRSHFPYIYKAEPGIHNDPIVWFSLVFYGVHWAALIIYTDMIQLPSAEKPATETTQKAHMCRQSYKISMNNLTRNIHNYKDI